MTPKKNLFEEMGFAKIDHHRTERCGSPEAIFCEGKTPEQVAQIVERMNQGSHNILATRANAEMFAAVKKLVPEAEYHETAKLIIVRKETLTSDPDRAILVITAGTSDIPVAEEAALTAELMGHRVERVFDVGVAGIHRLFAQQEKILSANVIIVAAGIAVVNIDNGFGAGRLAGMINAMR